MVWAIIIALGVYRRSNRPKGPLLDNIIATTNPTITEGILINVYKVLENALLPLKSFMPKWIPIGIHIKDATKVAVVDTNKDKKIIPYTSLSKSINSLNAPLKPSCI